MMPVKLVTFDVTGTLLFFRTPVFEKYLECGLKYGVIADSKKIKENFKHSWIMLNKAYPNFGKETGLGWQRWWTYLVEQTFTGYIKPEEKDKVLKIAEDLIAFHTSKEAFEKRPGTDELLDFLKTKSVKLAVISNYDPRLTRILEVMKLKQYFDFILASYDIGYQKPDARIFKEALRQGSCNKDEAIHIGNDLTLDYLGAKNAGLRAALITSNIRDLNNCKVDKNEVFENFEKLKAFFKNLIS